MSNEWRNELATEEQKEKLRFFGCTWDDGITAGQASDALEDCARQFPDAEADYQKSQPATEMQKEKLRFFGCTWNGDITVGKASEALGECERQFPDREAMWQLQKRKWVKIPGTFPVKEFDQLDKTSSQEVTIQKTEIVVSESSAKREALFSGKAEQPPLSYDEARAMTREGWNNWIALHGSYGTEAGHRLTYGEARALSEPAWIEWRVQHGRLSPQEIIDRQKKETTASQPVARWCSQCRKSKLVEHNGRYWCPDCGRLVTPLDPEIVVRLNLQITSTQEIVQRAAEPEPPLYLKYSLDPYLPVEFQQTDAENRRRYEKYVAAMERWNSQRNDGVKKQPVPFPEPPKTEKLNPSVIRIQEAGTGASPSATNAGQLDGKATDQEWRNAPATEKQKEKLRTFGCKFDEDITVGIAKLAIECYQNSNSAAQQTADEKRAPAPPREPVAVSCESTKEWDEWMALNERLKARQNPLNKTPLEEVTIQEAAKPQNSSLQEIIPEPPKDFRKPYEMFCPACDGQIEVPSGTVGKRRACPHCQAEVTPVFFKKKSATNFIPAREVQEFVRQKTAEKIEINTRAVKEPKRPKYLPYPREPRHHDSNSGLDFDYANWMKKMLEIETENQRRHGVYCSAMKNWYAQHNWKMDWEPMPFPKSPLRQNTSSQEVTIQEVAKPQIQKPDTYKAAAPIAHFVEWVDDLLAREQTCLGGHWLPAGPLRYHFEALTIGTSRQIAYSIESKGCCVEPDARFGSGTYERDQTLALFEPLDGDSVKPSTAYLGAANLLRLCVLIATADGKVDIVELDVFRRAIENQPGLTLTDHKRLLILEQLLVQELCSASKTAAKIAKSIPADNRLVIGKLLVEVAAANNVITDGERRVLGKIFKSFEIPPETLENLIAQICPSQWPRHDSVKSDVSKNDRWLWNHWRTGHPGVVIDDTTLDKKTWNFNDWKVLNARWRDLHEKLAARQKQPRSAPERSSQEAAAKSGSEQVSIKGSWLKVFQSAGRMLGTSSKKIPEPVAAPVPNDFTLDMARVYEITSETKEVVAILSVLMEDEPEKSIAPSATITLPAPEIPKISGDGKVAPQPTRFNGLDAAFHPILERLLARDSWTKNDFKSLADEFHFMPSKIHDTLNEWADEVLGDFILDGEDPVIIHRELIAKETIYG
jgi:uncharacterized tellurite resistance protein B-like protein